MPRSKLMKRRPTPDKALMEAAVRDVLQNSMSLRNVGDKYGISKSAICRSVAIAKKAFGSFSYEPKFATKLIFSPAQEADLVQYVRKAAQLHYGLTQFNIRKLAFQYAKANNLPMPQNWEIYKIAGENWLRKFRERHQELSLRKPEATSLARSTAFNRNTVSEFFNNYDSVRNKYKFHRHQIWNADETGLSTVHIPPKVFASKGIKQVGSMTSGERGQNVTMLAAVNAIGNKVPPMFVFPRVHFKQHMLRGSPSGSIGEANPSGWSNEEIFCKFIDHFISHTQPSLDNPQLLILDNHETHLSILAINKCKIAGVVLLTIPPHTSHKLQPLDRSVYGPFKAYYNNIMNDWMSEPENSGKVVTIYEVAEFAGKAYERSFTDINIKHGFQVSGIVPPNRDVFADHEFLPSTVTDRPLEKLSCATTSVENHDQDGPSIINENTGTGADVDAIINETAVELQEKNVAINITPEMIRPFPRIIEKRKANNRRRGKSTILTDTPEKLEIERRKTEKCKRDAGKNKKLKRKLVASSSDEDNTCVILNDESDEDYDISEEIRNHAMEENDKINVGDYILVLCKGEKERGYFVAHVLKINEGTKEYNVKYLKKQMKTDTFVYLENSEIYSVLEQDIILKLPVPVPIGGTVRTKAQLSFNIDFSYYHLG